MSKSIATFGGGCFWGVQKWFKKEFGDALKSSAVGYMGGSVQSPDYKGVCTGNTGHAEVLQLEFDPAKVSYTKLCQFFFRCHNPTEKDKQGNDVGSQYRSVIFAHDETQMKEAKAVLEEMNKEHWKGKIVTQIELLDASKFNQGEPSHQNYLDRNPTGYCNHKLYW